MPLLPPGAIFQSTVSSKFSYSPSETMSPPLPTRVSAPSTTCHPSGSVVCRYPRQPVVVLPSKRSFHPPPPDCGFGETSSARPAPAGVWLKPATSVQARTSAMEVGRFMPPSLFSWSRRTQNIMATYLGFDSSTQSLTATVIEVTSGERDGPFRDPRRRGLRAAGRQRVSHGRRCGGVAGARRRGPAHGADRRDVLEDRLAGVAGLQHHGGVRRPDERAGWRRGSRAADRVARVRALHRGPDPEVRLRRSGRLHAHGADSPRELVHGVAARRPPCAARTRRRIGDEPDGSGGA